MLGGAGSELLAAAWDAVANEREVRGGATKIPFKKYSRHLKNIPVSIVGPQ
jgi:cellobiose-specific phosphotransferase system component IIB